MAFKAGLEATLGANETFRLNAMGRWTFALLIALLGATLALPAAAQWKWRDKSGQTQYSDLPPPAAVPEQDILSRPNAASRRAAVAAPAVNAASASASAIKSVASAASTPGVAKPAVEPELEAKRKKAEADQAAATQAEEAKVAVAKAENCSRAKVQLRSLESGMRIARTNDKGEREFLDDKQRADESKRTRDVISSDCK
jgi:hypothetical protein